MFTWDAEGFLNIVKGLTVLITKEVRGLMASWRSRLFNQCGSTVWSCSFFANLWSTRLKRNNKTFRIRWLQKLLMSRLDDLHLFGYLWK